MDVLASNKKVVLLGNEAIARSAIDAGMQFASAYPGTPSSEIGMTIAKVAKDLNIYFEFSTNEKVAFEAAAGAAFSGVTSLVCMKHFGFNVASDAVIPVAYLGVNAPLVIVCADDPDCFGSAQSEQDSRYYAKLAGLPMLEPSDPEDAYFLTKQAFEISAKHKIPVMLRTTTKVSHAIQTIKLPKLKKKKAKKGFFKKDISHYYNIRPNLQELHKKLLEKLNSIEKEFNFLNKIYNNKNSACGIICSGVSFDLVMEILQEINKKIPVAKLSLTWPINQKFIANFIKNKQRVLVVEELEPIIEDFVKKTAKEINPKLEVYGKNVLPRNGAFDISKVKNAILKFLNQKIKPKKEIKFSFKIPKRFPTFCQGCPHRATFYAVKQVVPRDTIFAGDIGCYMLGIYKPYEMQDFIICMGASEGVAHGINKASKQKPVVFIGDSTFFHAGMPALLNMKYNNSKPLVIVMDNRITAMTGHQPCATTGKTALGDASPLINPEDVAKAFGIKNVAVVNPYNQKEVMQKVKEFYSKDELAVIVSRAQCRLLTMREFKKKNIQPVKFQINQDVCKKCGICTDKFSCPAIEKHVVNGKLFFTINQDLCWGCGVCSQICPAKAIKPSKLLTKNKNKKK